MSGWNFKTDPVQNIVTQSKVFSKDECEEIIRLADDIGWQEATYATEQKNTKSYKGNPIRDSKTVFIFPAENTFWLFEKMSKVIIDANQANFGFNLSGFVEGFQITKYEAPTGHYDFHIDKYDNGIIRKISAIVSLSPKEDYEGGEFVIKTSAEELHCVGNQGSIVIIPSYILHKVNPVTKGTRYSLVAWTSGEPFK